MAGCFGNHPYDRAMERQLMEHLGDEEFTRCQTCGNDYSIDYCEYDDETESHICTHCGAKEVL